MATESDYLEAVDRCYAALDQSVSLGGLTRFLGRILDVDAGDIVAEDPSSGEVRTFGSFGFDPVYRDLYDEAFLGANPWAEALLRRPPGQPQTDLEELPAYRNSGYFNDWVRPQRLHNSVGARLSALPGQPTVWVGFARAAGGRTFGGAGVETLARVLPHLDRVIALADRVGSAGALANASGPAVLVRADGGIIDSNAAADRLIDGERLRRTGSNRLVLTDGKDNAAFRRALMAAVSVLEADAGPPTDRSGEVCLAHDRRGGVTALRVVPYATSDPCVGAVRRCALVLLCDGQAECRAPDLRALALEFRLTPTERDLVAHLASGLPLDDFAEARGMAVSTARWHLKNAEAKTGTNRAEQLVALAYQRGFRGMDGPKP